MRFHRFYIPELIGTKTELIIDAIETVHQIRHVFRLKTGDSLIVFDGSGTDYTCRIEEAHENSLKLAIMESHKSRFVPTRDIYLYAAIVKKDTFEWIVEKATELGVTHIIPVIAEHSEKKGLNEKRLQKIAIEASEQSGRGNVPKIMPILELKESIDFCRGRTSVNAVAFHTEGERSPMSDIGKNDPIAVFIGPEGGWSLDEIALFHKNDISVSCLGPQVLRAETAVVAALSQVVFGN